MWTFNALAMTIVWNTLKSETSKNCTVENLPFILTDPVDAKPKGCDPSIMKICIQNLNACTLCTQMYPVVLLAPGGGDSVKSMTCPPYPTTQDIPAAADAFGVNIPAAADAFDVSDLFRVEILDPVGCFLGGDIIFSSS